jgi:succinate dehydrogenase / fumarate reductase membrane anchor subunit
VRRPLSGLPAWLMQRLSAVFMLGFIVFGLVHFLVDPPHSYEAWRGWVGNTGVSVAAVLFVAALLTHAWVGLRDVTLDYVAPLAARIATLSLIAAALLAVGAWAVRILLLGRG